MGMAFTGFNVNKTVQIGTKTAFKLPPLPPKLVRTQPPMNVSAMFPFQFYVTWRSTYFQESEMPKNETDLPPESRNALVGSELKPNALAGQNHQRWGTDSWTTSLRKAWTHSLTMTHFRNSDTVAETDYESQATSLATSAHFPASPEDLTEDIMPSSGMEKKAQHQEWTWPEDSCGLFYWAFRSWSAGIFDICPPKAQMEDLSPSPNQTPQGFQQMFSFQSISQGNNCWLIQ